MYRTTKRKIYKIMAAMLALILMVSMIIPFEMHLDVFAATIGRYTVSLTDGADIIELEGVEVTITNVADSSKTATSTTDALGVATFDNFVEEGEEYAVSVAEPIGYEVENGDSTVKVGVGEVNCDVIMTALEKTKVSVTVVDENNNAYQGAGVTVTGYGYDGDNSLNLVTNESGKYLFDAYVGKNYGIKIKAGDEKYNEQEISIDNLSSDYVCKVQLTVKTFDVEVITNNTPDKTMGSVSGNESIKYGTDAELKITANQGYCLKAFCVDGIEIENVQGEKSYEYSVKNVTDDRHKVSVEFDVKTYNLSFTVGENGEVIYNNDSTDIIDGGSVEINKSFDESTDAENPTKVNINATPIMGYRVSKVIIDGASPLEYAENDKIYDGDITMDKDHTFVVEFAPNNYSVTVISTENGSAISDVESVPYGGAAHIKITPKDGYNIDSVKVNNSDSNNYVIDSDYKSYILTVENISEDTTIEVNYSEVTSILNDNKEFVSWNEGILSEAVEENIVKYIYDKDDKAVFEIVKDYSLIRVNGEVQVEKSKWTATGSTLVKTIEVYSDTDKKWYSVKLDKDIQIVIDNTAPTVITDKSDMGWTNAETVIITGNASDEDTSENPSSGLSHIVWSKNIELTPEQVVTETVNKVDITDGKFTFESESGEQDATYYVYAVDIAGNVSDKKTVKVGIDVKIPKITGFSFEPVQQSDTEISFLTFGTIYKDHIKVSVSASDDAISSRVKEITLYCDNEKLATNKVDNNGSAVFELTEETCKTGVVISAVATDTAGNLSVSSKPTDNGIITEAKSDIVKIDATASKTEIVPEIAIYKDGNKLWYNKNAALNVDVNDSNTGIKSIEIMLNGTVIDKDINGKDIGIDYSIADTMNADFLINTSQNAVDGENKLEVTVTNNAGVTSVIEQLVYIDTTMPDITHFEITKVGGTILDKALNFLTFGTFFNEKVEVTVTASDMNATSEIKSITLFADGDELETKITSDNKCTFIIPAEVVTDNKMHFDKTISAKATDNVGNVTALAVEPTTNNSNIENSHLMIETVKPTVEVECVNPMEDMNLSTVDGKDWYADDVEFNITTGDRDSGIRNVLIKINNKEIVNEKLNAEKIESKKYTVDTSAVARDDDGSYTLSVMVTDNAGNVSETFTKTIYKDTDKPYITGFDFEPVDYVEGEENASSVEVKDYGFYFNADTKVIISAKDETPTAGIKNIQYYTVDIDKGKSEEIVIPVNADGEIEVTVKANFKGQIYAKAADNVLNNADAFVTPDSAIVEDEEKHNAEEHITFIKENTEYKTNDNIELYKKDVPVKLTIMDTYSGIREIEWSVTAPYDDANNQNGKIIVNNDKSFVAGSDDGWTVTKTENNLVTEMSKTIVVNNNSNDIVVNVKMTDRAGNVSEKEIKFSVDKTMPVISVVYDNNTPDETYQDIYKNNRIATITVQERNFSSNDVICEITNTDGAIPVVSSWEEHENANNPDETYYTASVVYEADGDYTFDISYADLAGNKSETFTQHKFTLDKTNPVISVAYNNNNALNGNYFSADRVATITIVEHNFDAARVNVLGTATDNENAVIYPAIGEWVTDGDAHVANIAYSADAKYSFDIEFTDKAGNSIDDYTMEEFYVDKTAPTLEISGIADKSANNGTVAPVITYTDTNFNIDAVNVTLTGVNNGAVEYSYTREDITNGQKFTYADFEKLQKVDDIYTLTVSLIDRAGNETNKTISFSVNRFGSVYDLSEVADITGKFINSEKDIVIVETNVDALSHENIKVKMMKNGAPFDLVEGTDYIIEESGGNGQWSVYKYIINKKLFADDGHYNISVYSIDEAGNVNENINEKKNAEISFGIDKTNPVIVPADFENGKQYAVELKEVAIEIKDNLVLDSVKIYLNDKEVEYKVAGEIYTFDIPESNKKQSVKIVAIDAAGNEQEIVVGDFLVSTNVFVRWYNNTPLFIGSIVGVAALILVIAAFALFGKKKKEDKKQAN